MSNTSDLNYYGDNPGASKHGNFINYYQFNKIENRLDLLSDLNLNWGSNQTIKALDLGCNTGELTQKLYEYFKEKYNIEMNIIGIDLDNILVERAKELNRYIDNIEYKTINIMNILDNNNLNEEFMIESFDIIFCFSLTMWIHLNNGDEGLLRFLKFISNSCGNLVLIEPQPWKCYKSAKRRISRHENRNCFSHFDSLKIRDNVVEFIIKFFQRNHFSKVFESNESKWKRKIFAFKKN